MRRAVPTPVLLVAAICGLLGSACSDDPASPDETPTIVATWDATSFSALAMDFIAEGMTLTVTLGGAGDYSLQIEDDLIGACNPGPDCTNEGSYVATATQVTLDPGTRGRGGVRLHDSGRHDDVDRRNRRDTCHRHVHPAVGPSGRPRLDRTATKLTVGRSRTPRGPVATTTGVTQCEEA
jgi:hypothetical protein